MDLLEDDMAKLRIEKKQILIKTFQAKIMLFLIQNNFDLHQ